MKFLQPPQAHSKVNYIIRWINIRTTRSIQQPYYPPNNTLKTSSPSSKTLSPPPILLSHGVGIRWMDVRETEVEKRYDLFLIYLTRYTIICMYYSISIIMIKSGSMEGEHPHPAMFNHHHHCWVDRKYTDTHVGRYIFACSHPRRQYRLFLSHPE